MAGAAPGGQGAEKLRELSAVDAVLLQVGQAGVVALRWVAAASPVTAGQVLRLKGHTHTMANGLKLAFSIFFFSPFKKRSQLSKYPMA